MRLLKILNVIIKHPLNKNHKVKALWVFFKWQIGVKFLPYPVLYPFIDNIRFLAWKGLTSATGNIYCGLYEYNDMLFLLHFLKEGDLFFDIGANIGTYSLLASGVSKAFSICYEPTPSIFQILEENLKLNNLAERAQALNMGVGHQGGMVSFVATSDSEKNHVANKTDKNTIEIKLTKIDDEVEQYGLPLMVKIDVEGYELNVLEGMNITLQNPSLKVVLIELNGSGSRYGIDDQDIHKKLLELGFLPYDYDPSKRSLVKRNSYGEHNTLYIRDFEFVFQRITQAKKIEILGNEF